MAQTVTIELSDEIADRLARRAEQSQTDLPQIAARLIEERLEADASVIDPIALEALREGIADGEAGQEQSFEDYRAEMQAERAMRAAARLAANQK